MRSLLRSPSRLAPAVGSLILCGCLQAVPGERTSSFVLAPAPELAAEPALAPPADPAAEADPGFEAIDLFGDGPVYTLAAKQPAAAGGNMGVYTKLRVMVTLDAVSYRSSPQHAALTDVARVIVGVKSSEYTITQEVKATGFTSGGRYVQVDLPAPDGALVVAAQAIAKNGQLLATKSLTLPAAGRKAYAPLSLALKFPPPPPSPRPTPKPTPAPLCAH